jgi:hypothetical protein
LYWFFAERNFFELHDTAKGIVATGPVAAYVGIMLMSWQIYKKLGPPPNPTLKDLSGKWTFASSSMSGSTANGTCYIKSENGTLAITGTFTRADHAESGSWRCEMISVKDNTLRMAYTLTTVGKDETDTVDGITILTFGEPPVNTMTGIWVIAGKQNMSGTVVYTRSAA